MLFPSYKISIIDIFSSLKEVEIHIEKIRTKFGYFNYAAHGIVFEPAKMDDYVNQMITEPKPADEFITLGDENVTDSEKTICSDCEENELNEPENAFVLPCKSPHILIWAKYNYQFYRPAKVMCVTFDDNGTLRIRFFGDHVEADVRSRDCYVYSELYPDDSEISDNLIYDLAQKVGVYYLYFIQYRIFIKIYVILLSQGCQSMKISERNLGTSILQNSVLFSTR